MKEKTESTVKKYIELPEEALKSLKDGKFVEGTLHENWQDYIQCLETQAQYQQERQGDLLPLQRLAEGKRQQPEVLRFSKQASRGGVRLSDHG